MFLVLQHRVITNEEEALLNIGLLLMKRKYLLKEKMCQMKVNLHDEY